MASDNIPEVMHAPDGGVGAFIATFRPTPLRGEDGPQEPDLGENGYSAGDGPFTLAHLAWLHMNNLIPSVPSQLGPVPGIYIPETRIEADLRAWGVLITAANGSLALSEGSEPTLRALCGDCEVRVWGAILLDAQEVAPPDLSQIPFQEFGLHLSVRRTPTVRFLVAVTVDRIVSATVAEGAVAFTEQWRDGPPTEGGVIPADVADDVGQIIWEICDPTGAWTPHTMSGISVPMEFVDELLSDSETGARIPSAPKIGDVTDEDQPPQEKGKEEDPYAEEREAQANAIASALASRGTDHATARAMSDLAKLGVEARVQVCATGSLPEGAYTPLGISGGIIFTGEGTSIVSLPVFNGGYPSIEYRSATADNLEAMVSALCEAAMEKQGYREVNSTDVLRGGGYIDLH